MTPLSNENFIYLLDSMLDQVNLYASATILIFGTIGNIMNCVVLSQRQLRGNPCALYFLTSSVFNLISIVFGLTTRIMASWHLDPTHTNDWFCKFRVFIVFTSRNMAIWLIMLASIDRWLLSSSNSFCRKLSNLNYAKLGIIISFFVSYFCWVHMVHCYEANVLDAPLKCYGKSLECRLVTDIIYLLVTILIPTTIMTVFSLMIISNVQQLRGRVQALAIESMRTHLKQRDIKLKRTDHHLLRMLLLQVLLLIIFCMPQALHKFYITFKPMDSKNNWRRALNHFLYNIDVLLAFVASGMPFYLYTLAGKTIFRRMFCELMRTIRRKIKIPLI